MGSLLNCKCKVASLPFDLGVLGLLPALSLIQWCRGAVVAAPTAPPAEAVRGYCLMALAATHTAATTFRALTPGRPGTHTAVHGPTGPAG